MEASELRIGNLIWNGIVVQVSEDYILFNDGYATFSSAKMVYDTVKPIPLTEEWLIKFGFEDNGQSYEIEYCVVRRNYNNKVMFDLFKNGEFIHSELKHVHQLQNLYFALTGKELTIKE